jgi:hypothetical protein
MRSFQPLVQPEFLDIGDLDPPAASMSGIHQQIHRLGYDEAGNPSQRRAALTQPLIADGTGYADMVAPVAWQGLCQDLGVRQVVGAVNPDELVGRGKVNEPQFMMNENFEQGRRRIWGAIDDPATSGVPAGRGAQTAGAVKRCVIADAPDGHPSLSRHALVDLIEHLFDETGAGFAGDDP